MKTTADIDIDFKKPSDLLQEVEHIPASIFQKGDIQRHLSGVYFQRTPIDPITGCCSLEYTEAEKRGYFKIDCLHNSVYDDLNSEDDVIALLEMPPDWDLLKDKTILDQLPHLKSSYYELIQKYLPSNVEELAILLSLIRPGKQHLQGKSLDEIKEEIWEPTEGYYFKKAHAFAYALSVIVKLNLLSLYREYNGY